MKDLSIYFSPISSENEQILNHSTKKSGSIGTHVKAHTSHGFPDLTKNGIAIFYVPEFRNSKYEDVQTEKFRQHFYQLFQGNEWNLNCFDLGDIQPGDRIEDTYFAVSKVIEELVKNQIIPVLIGGSQDLTMAMYDGFENLEQLINICSVDSSLDFGSPDEDIHAHGYLSHLLTKKPCHLFNYATIGLQAPLCSKEEIELFEKLYFDYCRLGEFNADFKKAEPLLRNSDILSIDLTSIRFSELVDTQYDSPNGFYADQICQITKYAGISDKLTAFGIFNYLPEKSKSRNISNLVAQMIWYFIDGVSMRKGDFPIGSKKDYLRFTVHLNDFKEELVFYKSNKSDRWWLEVPYPTQNGKKFERHHLVPCDQNDYDKAMNNEIPDLWWKTFQKLS
jgi:formiminoglutamase